MAKTNNKTAKNYIATVGRRKEAVARVRLYNPSNGKVTVNGSDYKKGDFIVNGKMVNEYFGFVGFAPRYNNIFKETDTDGKYVISAKVTGGGLSGQFDAVIHGVARALDALDSEKHHKILREKGYLTRDARIRERRKVGMGGKARRKKQSPKR